MNEERFFVKQPVVKLYKTFTDPYVNSLSTARSCYSSCIIEDHEITADHDRIAKGCYEGGHHTIYTHATFEFQLSNVSRHFVWSFLHQNIFSNSEQSSQRYVPVKRDSFVSLLPTEEMSELAIDKYNSCIEYQMNAYHKLTEMLTSTAETEYKKLFKHKDVKEKKIAGGIKKKAMEVARFVLPIGCHTSLYHTISAISLFRLYRASGMCDTPFETKLIIQMMVDAVLAHDPNYAKILETPMDIENSPEFQFFQQNTRIYNSIEKRKKFINEFDTKLQGKKSKLVNTGINNELVLAESVRTVLGVTWDEMNDDDAIDMALNPAKNKLLSEKLNLTPVSKVMQTLHQVSYTFAKRISHCTDSQNQRHRKNVGAKPIIYESYFHFADFETPKLVEANPAANVYYMEVMEEIWSRIQEIHALGANPQFTQLLLPNAVNLRFYETGDLAALWHKYKMRLCLNAQDSIWQTAVEEVLQIQEIDSRIGAYLLPPCGINYLANPKARKCFEPEYCGQPIWLQQVKDYKRVI